MENEKKQDVVKKQPEYLFIPLLARERLLAEIIPVIHTLNTSGSNIKEYNYTNINIVSILIDEKTNTKLGSLLTIYKSIPENSKLHNCINYLVELEATTTVSRFQDTYDEDGNVLRYPSQNLINTEKEKGIIPGIKPSSIKINCVSPEGVISSYTQKEQRIGRFLDQVLKADKMYLPTSPKDNFMYASIEKAKSINLIYKNFDTKYHCTKLHVNNYTYPKVVKFNVIKALHDDNFINLITNLIKKEGYQYEVKFI